MQYANDYSGYGNETLYRMCREKPLHTDVDIIGSKLWLIGRSYSAAIERKAGANFQIEAAAEIIANSNIDIYIASLSSINRIEEKNIDTLLLAHKYLTELLRQSTGLEKRSLASKYLHFHAPKSTFIYDSIVNRNLRKIITNKIYMPVLSKEGIYDPQYELFTRRCIFFRNKKFEPMINSLATPRKIDTYLLKHNKIDL